jgi:hypothetical protein
MAQIRIVDLEDGLPSSHEAADKLEQALAAARRDRVRALKVIHGYGSTGSPGRLRTKVRSVLRIAKKDRQISFFVIGEQWRISDELAWELLRQVPELKQDSGLGRRNPGITLVLVK